MAPFPARSVHANASTFIPDEEFIAIRFLYSRLPRFSSYSFPSILPDQPTSTGNKRRIIPVRYGRGPPGNPCQYSGWK